MTIQYPFNKEQAEIATKIITDRVSVLQTKMIGNCIPDDETLAEIFQSALSAPDHGQLHPARFVVVKGDKLKLFLSEKYKIKKADKPDFPLSEEEFAKNFAGVGMFIVIYCAPHEKSIPEYEREWSVAASVQNMMNLFYANGYAAKWNSIYKGTDEAMKAFLGVDPSWGSMGYLLIGKSADTAKAKKRCDYKDHFINF